MEKKLSTSTNFQLRAEITEDSQNPFEIIGVFQNSTKIYFTFAGLTKRESEIK